MNFDPIDHHFDEVQGRHRRSIRLPGYDYSQPGGYFVTIVAQGRACSFGNITNDKMTLSEAGQVVDACWHSTPEHFTNVEFGTFVIMPNHVHGVIVLHDDPRKGVVPTPKGDETSPLQMPTLGQVIAYFKYQSTKQINAMSNATGALIWQRNYYDHIIRDEEEYKLIHLYIESNVYNWGMDDENPLR